MRNSFNMLLIALALFDTCYNAASLMETVRKCFGAASRNGNGIEFTLINFYNFRALAMFYRIR